MTQSNSNAHSATPPNFLDRYLTLVGNLSFAVLALLALVFWRERAILLDAAYQSFSVILNNKLAIQVDRYGAGFVQAFPLWLSRGGFSLQTVLMSFSLAFVLFHWLCFFITDKVLKVKSLALAILLFSTLMTAHSFFWIQNEVIQGTSLLLMTFGLLVSRGNFSQFRWSDYPLSIFLIFTVYFFHPLTLFPFAFLIAYFSTFLLPSFLSFLKKTPVSHNQKPPISFGLLLFTSIAWVGAWATKHYYTGVSPYDKGSSARFETHFVRNWEELLRGHSMSRFWQHCSDDFLLVVPFLLGITVFYIWKRQFVRLVVFLGATLGYIFIVSTAYFDSPDHHWFYLETQYLPLAALLAVPFAFEMTPSVFKPKIGLLLIGSLLIFRLLYIVQKSRVYTERQAHVQELMTKASRVGGTKFYVDYTHLDEKNRLFMAWGLAYESLYLSALKSPDSPLSIASLPDTPQLTFLKDMKTQLCTPFGNHQYAWFRPNLFNFRDTTNGYKLLQKADVE